MQFKISSEEVAVKAKLIHSYSLHYAITRTTKSICANKLSYTWIKHPFTTQFIIPHYQQNKVHAKLYQITITNKERKHLTFFEGTIWQCTVQTKRTTTQTATPFRVQTYFKGTTKMISQSKATRTAWISSRNSSKQKTKWFHFTKTVHILVGSRR